MKTNNKRIVTALATLFMAAVLVGGAYALGGGHLAFDATARLDTNLDVEFQAVVLHRSSWPPSILCGVNRGNQNGFGGIVTLSDDFKRVEITLGDVEWEDEFMLDVSVVNVGTLPARVGFARTADSSDYVRLAFNDAFTPPVAPTVVLTGQQVFITFNRPDDDNHADNVGTVEFGLHLNYMWDGQ